MKKQIETQNQREQLVKIRQQSGLFSIDELTVMFDCSRFKIDNALNSGKLQYISPNSRDRYIRLSDFEEYATKKGDLKND